MKTINDIKPHEEIEAIEALIEFARAHAFDVYGDDEDNARANIDRIANHADNLEIVLEDYKATL
jgi:hypothetical protein